MSDLMVIRAIIGKIKQYSGNEDVEKALNELLLELEGSYHGLSDKLYTTNISTIKEDNIKHLDFNGEDGNNCKVPK